MANIFESVSLDKVRHSIFPLNHYKKMTIPMGKLIPVLCTPLLPGDVAHVGHEWVMKLSTLLSPIMENLDVYAEDFFVPNRILWENWEKFIVPQQDGVFPAAPYISLTSNFSSPARDSGGLLDYLGYSVNEDNPSASIKADALPIRAYIKIWNEFYRDQNLQPEIDFHFETDGYDNIMNIFQGTNGLLNRCWPKDYFTSALPTTQRGGDVYLPLQGDANIIFDESGGVTNIVNSGVQTPGLPGQITTPGSSFSPGQSDPMQVQSGTVKTNVSIDNSAQLKADLSSVTSATINELRQAVALQSYLELNMRVGGRYIEYIAGNFHQRVPDFRLDRPQFLGGFRSPFVISQVDQTSGSTSTSPLGAMAGNGTSVANARPRKFKALEHGWLISLISVMPKASYQQGVSRLLTKLEPLDYFNPRFENLGEQAILNKEIYAKSADPDGTFGYAPRYAEYKYIPNTVHGEFRNSLNFWHMGRVFANEPKLNADFVMADPTQRIFAVEGDDQIRVLLKNKLKMLRPMGYHAVPKLVG